MVTRLSPTKKRRVPGPFAIDEPNLLALGGWKASRVVSGIDPSDRERYPVPEQPGDAPMSTSSRPSPFRSPLAPTAHKPLRPDSGVNTKAGCCPLLVGPL